MLSPVQGQSFQLNDDEIHVRYAVMAGPGDPRQVAAWLGLLDEAEIRRYEAFLSEKAKFEFLGARAFLRLTLARYLGAQPESLRFHKNQFGRPELVTTAGMPPLRFNVSHSDGLVACAITWRREIGLDVESMRGEPIAGDVAEHHFSASELADYQCQPTAAARHARFLEYWTLKEAYLKARGLGLQLPLRKFSFNLGQPDRIGFTIDPTFGDDASTWQLARLKPPPPFIGSIAAHLENAKPARIVEMMAEPG